jgi:hypothetical protein
MFTATGKGARKNGDGTISIAYVITNDLNGQVVLTDTVTGPDVLTIRQMIQQQLQKQKDAVTDSTLQAAVVGQVLASI